MKKVFHYYVLIYILIHALLQERSILLRKWFDLINQHKEDLAKLITAECVGILTHYIQDTSNVSVYKDSDMTIGYNSNVCTGETHEGVYRGDDILCLLSGVVFWRGQTCVWRYRRTSSQGPQDSVTQAAGGSGFHHYTCETSSFIRIT